MAVYADGVRMISDSTQAAAAAAKAPWKKLEAACIAHMEALLATNDYAQAVIWVLPNDVPNATRNLTIGSDLIQFSARFNGTSRELSIPVAAVSGIFARENTRGLFFQSAASEAEGKPPIEHKGEKAEHKKSTRGDSRIPPDSPSGDKPKLQVIK